MNIPRRVGHIAKCVQNETGKDKAGIEKGKRRMRVYLSGPITGKDEAEVKQCFDRAKKRFAGHEAVNPYEVGKTIDCKSMEHEDYMHISLALMDLCDTIYMMTGWEKSVGCNREYVYAKNKGMKILYERSELS